MDYYNTTDPSCKGYRVELEGTWRDDAVEASESGGWVKVETKISTAWATSYVEKKTLYGRVFIVKWEYPTPEPTQTSNPNPEPTYD